ncbi:MAG: DoxX family membrane protein [Phycisphaerales bacterium]|nr:DoxX family membrane protein [Phycisphaerales bacterium]
MGKGLSHLLALPVRLILGGLFLFAAYVKLGDPQQFAFSVHAFKILPEHLSILATFVIPWVEIVLGACLVLGCWTRAAATLLSLLIAGFLGGIISVIARKMDVTCGCFGKFEIPCTGPIGFCHVARNAVLLVGAMFITLVGPGPAAVDRHPQGG